MKIPENFKQKYSLSGESYPSKNVDAALSELFAVSGRLYKENADLKAEIAALEEKLVQSAEKRQTMDAAIAEAKAEVDAIVANARALGCEALITACPLCMYNLKENASNPLPVYYFTELLAEALSLKK